MKAGEHFGHLTVIKEGSKIFVSGKRERWVRSVICSCTCSKKIKLRLGTFRSGIQGSCGCLKVKALRKWKKEKHGLKPGIRFGRVILKSQKRIHGRTWWKTVCRCGEIRNIPQYDLSSVAQAKYCRCVWNHVPEDVKLFSKLLRGRLLFCLKRAGVPRKPAKSFELLGYSPMQLYKKLEGYMNKLCEVCMKRKVTKRNRHIDHKIMLASARTMEEVIKLNQLCNLRLICSTCNFSRIGNSILGERSA